MLLLTPPNIAEQFGVQPATIYRYLKIAGVKRARKYGDGVMDWKGLPNDEIVSRYLSGETSSQIAKSYGVTPRTIILRLRKKGARIRNRGKRVPF